MRTFPLRIASLLLVALAPLALAAGACGVEGTTATCKSDVDQTGNKGLDDGCNPTATCSVEPKTAENVARECCYAIVSDEDGEPKRVPLEGLALDECLYGFGVIGYISTSSSGGGAGGAGGAGGKDGKDGNGGAGGE